MQRVSTVTHTIARVTVDETCVNRAERKKNEKEITKIKGEMDCKQSSKFHLKNVNKFEIFSLEILRIFQLLALIFNQVVSFHTLNLQTFIHYP